MRLFRRQGYASTGLNEIVEESGAPKGSLYHYFPDGKASIAVAAVERAGERAADTLQEISACTSDTGELIIEYARLLARWMAKSSFRDGSPIATVLLELSPQNRDVSLAGRKAYASQMAVLTAKLRADGFLASRAERLGVLALAALQGALIQARVERSKAPILEAAEELRNLLKFEREWISTSPSFPPKSRA
jgi:TetR/AcrR family transcriptional repressor of lmrAB and yxaGH operons